jgi:hypothetical protein
MGDNLRYASSQKVTCYLVKTDEFFVLREFVILFISGSVVGTI